MKTAASPCFLPAITGIFLFAAAWLRAAALPSPVTTFTANRVKAAAVDPAGNLIADSSIGLQCIARSGAVLWDTALTLGRSAATGPGLVLDAVGNTYLTGYRGEVTGLSGKWDLAVTKVASDGTLLWESKAGLPGTNDEGLKIAVDDQGGVYAAGYSFTGDAQNTKDLFLAKFDSAGVFQWSRRFNGSADLADEATGLVAMPGGGVVVTGLTRNPNEQFITIRYSASGTPQWVNYYDDPAETESAPRGVVLTSGGGVAVAGMSGARTVVTVKYSAAGAELWVHHGALPTVSATAAGTAWSILPGPDGGAAVLCSIEAGIGSDDGPMTNFVIVATAGDGTTAWNKTVRSTPYGGTGMMTALPGGGYAVASGYSFYHPVRLINFARVTVVDAAGDGVSDALIWPEPAATDGNISGSALVTGSDGSVWVALSTDPYSVRIKRFGAATPPGLPIVSSFGVDNLQPTSIRFKALVNPNGLATDYNFVYGTTTNYGSTTPVRSLPGGTTALSALEPGVPVLPGVTYHYRLQVSNSAGSFLTLDQTFTTPQSPYQAWIIGAFGSLDAPGAGGGDDPDHDNLANLTEYTFGGNPAVAGGPPAGLPVFSRWESPDSGIVFPSIIYRPDASRTDVTITPLASNDLVTWTAAGIVITTLPDGSRRAVAQGLQHFMRLKITSP